MSLETVKTQVTQVAEQADLRCERTSRRSPVVDGHNQ